MDETKGVFFFAADFALHFFVFKLYNLISIIAFKFFHSLDQKRTHLT